MGIFFIVALAATFNLVSVDQERDAAREMRAQTVVVTEADAYAQIVVAESDEASTVAATQTAPLSEQIDGRPNPASSVDAEPWLDFGDGAHYLHPTEVAEFAR